MLSSGFLLFIINWIIEADYRVKWQIIKRNKGLLFIAFIPVIHLLGMFNTENIPYGLMDLKIKLPLLLPLFFLSSAKLTNSIKRDKLLLIFVLAAFIASIYGFMRFEFFSSGNSIEDLYKISILGQNIQVSLFATLALCILINQCFFSKFKISPLLKILFAIAIVWFITYIYFLSSYTGYAALVVALFYTIFKLTTPKKKMMSWGFLTTFVLLGLCFMIYINKLILKFNDHEISGFRVLPTKTGNGNLYSHDTLSMRTENGHYTDIFICKNELKKEWETRSGIAMNSKDQKGQNLEETLIRYLTSKGLKKDSSGVAQLSDEDMECIENGCANYLYTKKYSLESRVYHVYWQFKKYSETGNPTAQSFSQRIEFLKAAFVLIKLNFWLGVGSGDVMDSFKSTLKKMGSQLDSNYYNRVHNQYLLELVSLGIFGFIAFMFIILFSVFRFKIWKDYLLSTFYMIILISFLTDNPLETQLGVSFYSIFYCLLTIGAISKEPETLKNPNAAIHN
jgi:hypothetical protein